MAEKEVKRLAFKMKLNPGFKEEYRKRHAALWPEMKKMLKDSGVGNYSIFLDEETNILFAYQEVTGDSGSQDLGNEETTRPSRSLWSSFSSWNSHHLTLILRDRREASAEEPPTWST